MIEGIESPWDVCLWVIFLGLARFGLKGEQGTILSLFFDTSMFFLVLWPLYFGTSIFPQRAVLRN